MIERRPHDADIDWRAAALLGLVTSTFSTVVSRLGAAQIGRDPVVDWMVVAAIPLRDPALQAEPSWPVVIKASQSPVWRPRGRRIRICAPWRA